MVGTLSGSMLNGNLYSVASIKSWNGKSSLSRTIPEDEVLIFSSHSNFGLANSTTIKIQLVFLLNINVSGQIAMKLQNH